MRTSWQKRHVMRLVNKEKYATARNGIAFIYLPFWSKFYGYNDLINIKTFSV